MASAKRLEPLQIIERLSAVYGRPINHPSEDPVAELVLTVLSQNTADTNSGRAFTQMLKTYPSWDAIAHAPVEELVACIQIGGLANQKAPRIQKILAAVAVRSPDWDMSFLREEPLEDARSWLRSLPGVGPKTAACVLLFALDRPAMPVDTHVERVAKRLGLIKEKVTAEQAHGQLELLVEQSLFYAFHMSLIKHGRRTCTARRPHCGSCVLEPDCPSSEARVPNVRPR